MKEKKDHQEHTANNQGHIQNEMIPKLIETIPNDELKPDK